MNSNILSQEIGFSEGGLYVFGSFVQKISDSHPYTWIGRE